MNDFEKDPNYKGNQLIDAGFGLVYSLVFFSLIFIIGVVISYIN